MKDLMTMPLLLKDASISKSLSTASDNTVNTIAAKPTASIEIGTTTTKTAAPAPAPTPAPAPAPAPSPAPAPAPAPTTTTVTPSTEWSPIHSISPTGTIRTLTGTTPTVTTTGSDPSSIDHATIVPV